MIYEPVSASDPLRQGDIFERVPRVDTKLSMLRVLESDETVLETSWGQIIQETSTEPLTVLASVVPVMGIVIAQDCDTARGEFVSLCEIQSYAAVKGGTHPKDPKGWQSLITKTSRENLRYFYLPEAPIDGLRARMAADLRVLIRMGREDLEALRPRRVARLGRVAREHFRETIAQYFRRYPYDEWYPLTRDELSAYRKAKDDDHIPAFPWQEDPPPVIS